MTMTTLLLVALATSLLLAAFASAQTQPQSQTVPRVLVYTATAGYRHDSIPTAIDVFREQGPLWGVTFDFTEDPGYFVNETLAQYDAVLFALNSDEILNATGQAALKTFFQSGGVYTGVHAASACLFNDTNYQHAVGALFDYHPTIQFATFEVLNASHPATADLPTRWSYEEEIYYFRSDPRDVGAVVLMTVDNTSYTNDGTSTGNYSQGSPHPIAWYMDAPESSLPLLAGAPKSGRSFYTALGHLNSTWQNATFYNHVMTGLVWALDGASTRAYGVGLVGNGTAGAAALASGAATGSASTSGTGSGSASASTSASASAGAGASSSASMRAAAIELGGRHGAGAGAVVVGAAVVLGGLWILF
ncbi:hypothetical protein Q5752_006888 [Cryptotrichosporon argae]